MAFPLGLPEAEGAGSAFFPCLVQKIIQSSGKEKADAKCIHQDCLFSLCCVLGVMKDPAHHPQPAATQQNAACWKVTELSAPSDKAAHVSFSGTRDGGGGGSHICQTSNSLLQSAPMQELQRLQP